MMRVKRVAEIARLSLTSQELKEMDRELKEVLKEFRVLEKANTSGVEPSFQPIEIKNTTRKDLVEPSLPRGKAMANTKNKERGLFKGPRVV